MAHDKATFTAIGTIADLLLECLLVLIHSDLGSDGDSSKNMKHVDVNWMLTSNEVMKQHDQPWGYMAEP